MDGGDFPGHSGTQGFAAGSTMQPFWRDVAPIIYPRGIWSVATPSLPLFSLLDMSPVIPQRCLCWEIGWCPCCNSFFSSAFAGFAIGSWLWVAIRTCSANALGVRAQRSIPGALCCNDQFGIVVDALDCGALICPGSESIFELADS